jgi:hypothetical protein
MWAGYRGICPLISITNAQNYEYWANAEMYKALKEEDDNALRDHKRICKEQLFELVADQNGEIYDPDVLTPFLPSALRATSAPIYYSEKWNVLFRSLPINNDPCK